MEKQNSQIRKERFEFKLTINDNIICQRYFKINNFNENSLTSIELKDAIDYCVNLIDNDLKSKSRIYLWYTAPYIFNNENEMYAWFDNVNNTKNVRFGEYIYLRDSDTEYWWNGNTVLPCVDKVNDGELTSHSENDEPVIFKFAFLDSDKEVYSKIWDGSCYPKFVRNGVDLSNKKGKFEGDDVNKLNFENSLLYHMVNDKVDLVPLIIKEICDTCTASNKWYTSNETYKSDNNGPKKNYSYSINDMWNKYVSNLASNYKTKTEKYLKTL